MLDGIGEDVGFTFAILLGILLGTDDDSFRAMHAIDAVYNLVQAPHLLNLLGIDVEQMNRSC